MKNKDSWKPSKYIFKDNKLIASRVPKEVNIGSRLIADLIAGFYNYYIKKYCKGKLIDLGCGKVPLYGVYKDLVTDIICVDWNNVECKNDHLDFKCDLTNRLPFQDNEFDTIILSDVLEHIPKPENLWNEMYRILAPGGRILLNVPFYYWIHAAPYDYYRYTEWALRRFAESEGFKVLLLKSIGGSPEILADIFAKHLLYIPVIGKFLSNGIQSIAIFLIKTRLSKKISEKSSHNFPLGYFMVVEK